MYNKVTLTWVPGHSGILGNEKADELARKGSSSRFTGAEPAVGVYAGLMRSLVRRKTTQMHQKRWDELTNCRQAKEFLAGCNTATTKFLLSLNRTKLRAMVGVLTGHASLRYHLKKMGIVDDPTCRWCGFEPETARHFICACPALKSLRTRYLGDFYLTPEEQLNICLPDMMNFISGSKWLADPERVT